MFPPDFPYYLMFTLPLVIAMAVANLPRKKFEPFRPLNFVMIFLLLSTSISYAGYYVFQSKHMITYTVDFTLAFKIYLVALIGLLIGYLISSRFVAPVFLLGKTRAVPKANRFSFDLKAMNLFSNLFLAAGIAMGAVWFYKSGIIPMLYAGNIDQIRFVATETADFGIYSRFIYSISLVLGIKLIAVRLLILKNIRSVNFWDVALISGGFIVLFLFGAKMLYLFPIILYLMNYSYFIKRVSLKRFFSPLNLSVITTLALIAIFVTNFRGLSRSISVDLVADGFAVFFPEFRDMARVVDIFELNRIYDNSLASIWISAMPKEVFTLTGQDKPCIENLPYKEMLGYQFPGGSVRIGLIGELYSNARYTGTFAGMGIFGAILAFLEIGIRRLRNYSFFIIIANVILFRFVWLLVSELPNNLPLTYLYLYILAIFYFLVTPLTFIKMNKQPQPYNTPNLERS